MVRITIKAATLIESLVAMIIIVLCLAIATMIYVNVLNSDKQRLRQKAQFMLDEEMLIIKREKHFFDFRKEAGDWTIEQTVVRYENTENLYHLKLLLLDNEGKILFCRNELILKE
jgi:competence protein ComGF